jgi:hypothetical protein
MRSVFLSFVGSVHTGYSLLLKYRSGVVEALADVQDRYAAKGVDGLANSELRSLLLRHGRDDGWLPAPLNRSLLFAAPTAVFNRSHPGQPDLGVKLGRGGGYRHSNLFGANVFNAGETLTFLRFVANIACSPVASNSLCLLP